MCSIKSGCPQNGTKKEQLLPDFFVKMTIIYFAAPGTSGTCSNKPHWLLRAVTRGVTKSANTEIFQIATSGLVRGVFYSCISQGKKKQVKTETNKEITHAHVTLNE